jgi:hypothetical protein
MFDPNADPLSDPMLAELAMGKLMRAADHPWELEQPPDWDPLAAVDRFLRLVTTLRDSLGIDAEVQLWPAIRSATFHAELVLPTTVVHAGEHAVLRASNFGDLLAILRDDSFVQPDTLEAIRRLARIEGYRFIPSTLTRRKYNGHHRGTRQFATWSDRLFDYI